MAERWRRCSACKQDIALGALHYVCSVSTCNRKRTGLVFCSVDCWEIHLPTERHREAWAVEARAPTKPDPPEAAPRVPRARRDAGTAGLARRAEREHVTADRGRAEREHVTVDRGRAQREHVTTDRGRAQTGPSTSPPSIVRRRADRGGDTRPARPAASSRPTTSRVARGQDDEDDILVVASRLKAYVRARSGFNTSDRVLPVLSRALRAICDEAIENARRAERLTVMARDVPRD